MRLIDADKLPKHNGYALSASEVAKAVENAPTVDAVPVVRCKDCKHYEPFREHYGFCKIGGMLNGNGHFCAYGERKGGDE